jgi:hypothetical protein
MGIFAVEIVLAGIDDRQLPERGHVHHLVEQPLAERAVAEEADGDGARAEALGGQRSTRGDAGGAADDGVGAQIAVFLVGDVHRSALAAAIAFRLAEQLAEHFLELRALGDAVAVAAVGGGDVVCLFQRLADADGNRLLAGIHVREAGHLGRKVELVGIVLEGPDARHLAVHPEIAFRIALCCLGHERFPFSLHSPGRAAIVTPCMRIMQSFA